MVELPLKEDLTGDNTTQGKFKVAIGKLYDVVEKRAVPTGVTLPFPTTTAPVGYLELDGSLLSRDIFFNLWSFAEASGNIRVEAEWSNGFHGGFSLGDNSTTFRIPDVRGDFIRYWDNDRGVDNGRAIGSNQNDELKSHKHLAHPSTSGGHDTTGYSVTYSNLPAGYSLNTANTGGNETRPRNTAMMPCIKY